MKNVFNQAVIAHPEAVKGGTSTSYSKGHSKDDKGYDDKGKFKKDKDDDKGYDDKKGKNRNKKGYSDC